MLLTVSDIAPPPPPPPCDPVGTVLRANFLAARRDHNFADLIRCGSAARA